MGASWSERNTGIKGQAFTVFWDGNRVLAAGRRGEVVASPDGVTWETLHPDTADYYLADLAWNGNRYVGAGFTESGLFNGVIATSTDGKQWTRRIYENTSALQSVIWTGSGFFAFGRDRASLSSADGSEWMVNNPEDPGVDFAVWNGTVFVGGERALNIRSSADGLTWTNRKTLPSSFENTVYCGVWSGSHFVLAGIGTVWTSSDGVAWTGHETPMKDIHTLVKAEGRLFAFGQGGEVWSAGLEGSAWRRERQGRFDGNGAGDENFAMTRVTWTGERLVAVGLGSRAWTAP